MRRSLRDLLASERVPVGSFVKLPSVAVIEILGMAGFDFLIIDYEHSPLSLEQIDAMLAVGHAADLPLLVRVGERDSADCQRFLDAGAAGVLFPRIETADACAEAVRAALHPPHGTRGSGAGMRAGGWGIGHPRDDYVSHGREHVVRMPMIETLDGVRAAKEIVAIGGVDACFVGPGDLSLSMGTTASDPRVWSLVHDVFEVSKAAGVPVGTLASSPASAAQLISDGFDFIAIANDTGILARGAAQIIDEIRGA